MDCAERLNFPVSNFVASGFIFDELRSDGVHPPVQEFQLFLQAPPPQHPLPHHDWVVIPNDRPLVQAMVMDGGGW
jgi:hypothetical protein